MTELFGHTPHQQPVERWQISNGTLSANVLTWGASMQNLQLAGVVQPLILGFERFEHYLQYGRHMGAIAGRVANRIAHGRFSLNGHNYTLPRNFLAKHTLHGGEPGFSQRLWQVVDHAADFVRLAIDSPDGEQGFPGQVRAEVCYRLLADAVLEIELAATTNAPTLGNLAQHNYYNLDGSASVAEHELWIAAEHLLAIDAEKIPTGELLDFNTEAQAFDFRQQHPIGAVLGQVDHNYCLSRERTALRPVARLHSARSGISMTLQTTEAGLQVYGGAHLNCPEGTGLQGRAYQAGAGIALEAQAWPDAVNHPPFPSVLLTPEQPYRQLTRLEFSA